MDCAKRSISETHSSAIWQQVNGMVNGTLHADRLGNFQTFDRRPPLHSLSLVATRQAVALPSHLTIVLFGMSTSMVKARCRPRCVSTCIDQIET